MARSWQQPRWRRILMQMAMVAVLGVTVGVAALVDRHRHELLRLPLGTPIQCGPIMVELPSGAMVTTTSGDPGLLTAVITQSFPAERQVFVTVAAPAEAGILEGLLKAKNPNGVEQQVPFGRTGSKGTLYVWSAVLHDGMYETAAVEIIATSRMNEQAGNALQVTIRLKSIGASDDLQTQTEMDIEIVKEIAASIARAEETASIAESNYRNQVSRGTT